MTNMQLTGIYRYPVKGLAEESLTRVTLSVDRPLPLDRIMCIGHGNTPLQQDALQHVGKKHLVARMSHGELAQLAVEFTQNKLTVRHPRWGAATCDLPPRGQNTPLSMLLDRLLPAQTPRPIRVFGDGKIHFTDIDRSTLSILYLPNLRALEDRLRRPLDPRRFRANLVLDGDAPMPETDWLGRELHIGDARLKITELTDRCRAIDVDPDTGARDTTLKDMKQALGHIVLGNYAQVTAGGRIGAGDAALLS